MHLAEAFDTHDAATSSPELLRERTGCVGEFLGWASKGNGSTGRAVAAILRRTQADARLPQTDAGSAESDRREHARGGRDQVFIEDFRLSSNGQARRRR